MSSTVLAGSQCIIPKIEKARSGSVSTSLRDLQYKHVVLKVKVVASGIRKLLEDGSGKSINMFSTHFP